MSNGRLSYFSDIMPTLAARSLLASISQLGFANPPLRRHLRDLFSQPYGRPGALLADPTFEAVFGWKGANCKMSDLEGQLLASELVDAMDAAGEFRFGKEFEPYVHQLKSWEILNGSEPQSLVVTSGTGSGKTECFMVPILDHLTRLRQEYGRLIGVRALFLYPLNALINSQRNRLKAWTSPFSGDIRFCLYNGNTPERPDRSSLQPKDPCEVLDRTSLRGQPPPILVTNSTMLEYMLVRTQDAPILEQSQGKLEWVVLDEAHTYIGSQAAEIALLLRRVLNAFGVEPGNVRFVATSATIGDPDGEAGESLKRFLADVAGVNISRVHLVSGSRQIPAIPGEIQQYRIPIEELEKIDPENEASHGRYAALCSHPQARRIRQLFTESGEASQVARLSEVCAVLYGQKQEYTADEQHLALRWLDLLSGTRNTDKDGRRGESFLPLRAHFFHQTLSGIWACADPGCAASSGTALDNESWPFGKIYLEPRKHCECGSPVYEVANCGDCGTVYLLAAESNGYLHHLQPSNVLDEFELDKDEDDNEEIESEEDLDNPVRRRQHAVLIVNRQLNHTGPLTIRKTSRQITEDLEDVLTLQAHEDDGNGLVCPCCETKESSKHRLFRHGRLSASFLLGNILPSLLEYAPDGGQPLDHPYRGRRLLTFNDSRQGTARIAAKLQQEAERNRVRGLVYHLTLQHGQAGMEDIDELKKRVADLKRAYRAAPNDTLRDLLEKAKEKLNKAGQPKPVPFDELAQALADQSRDMRYMRDYYRRYAPDVFDNEVGDLTLARMFLVREFGRRPKRANNLETMGLVATAYPALDKVTEVPQRVKEASGFDLATWRAFLKICLDFFVRAGGSLSFPREWKSWLGMRFGQTWLVPHDQEHVGRNMRRWSSVQRGKSSSLLVRLLAYVMQVDLDSDLGKDKVDIVLRAAWDALCGIGLLRQEADGRVLPLDQLAFRLMDCGYICPVTRRFLDTTLQGVTPYLPKIASEATAKCRDYRIPLFPNAFGDESDELLRIRKAREWLAEQKQIEVLRDLGAWSTLNDRVIELAPLFKAAEHSAQQSAQRLQRYEKAFQEGDVNVLACSTTMEMGIDIGGISLVAMNNVPPHPSNYLQRAGRAGRRQEARSLAMTLCKSNPHDQSVFGNTRWAFDNRLPAPKVSLDSPVIVQRHVQAHLLSWFLQETLKGSNQEQLKLSCAAFFLAPEDSRSLSMRFSTWCRRLSAHCPDRLAKGLKHILRNTVHERTAPKAIFNMAADEMGNLTHGWKAEWENLDKDRAEIKAEAGEKSPAYRAISFHIKRLEDEYLLRELANRGFLPAYGFPGHIAPFDNYTVAQFKRDQRAREEGREDNRCRFREMPSRDLAAALREYAPGSHIVLDGVVYRSAGLTLNWHIPADQEDIREVQNLKFVWRCRHCGASGSSHSLDEARICQSCGKNISAEYHREFIEPAGFAVDFYETPSNDIDTQSFIPVEQPWISLEAPWTPLPNPDLGRFRTSSKGHVFHQSRGIHGKGYALCLECGRAEPMQADNELPDKFRQPHRKLRRSKDDAPFCPGSEESWKIKSGITLGYEAWTDVCEIQLKTTDGIWLNDKVAATTLAVALRDALAELMGVQATELGCNVKPVRMDDGTQCQSILLFDKNAAGYASSLGRFIESVFHKARHQLQCPANCDSVCPQCVLDFDQRFAAEQMDRHCALEVISEPWLKALALPEEYAYLGGESRLECLPLVEAIWQSISENTITELYFHVGGDPEQWDVGPSPLRQLAYQFAAHGIDVSIVIPKALLDRIEETDRQLLAGMANSPHIRIVSIENRPSARNGWLLAEAIGQSSTTWACDTQDSQLFNSEWGQQQQVLVRAPIRATEGVALQLVDVAELQPVPVVQGDREIELHHELDGGMQGFGKRFWDYLISEHQATRDRLQSSDRIIGLRYQDRYLFSPLSVRLLFEILRGLREKTGEESFQVNSLIIDTLVCRPQTGHMNRPQQFLWSDWDDNDMREAVLNVVFREIGLHTQVRLADGRQAAHGRLLEIGFESGANVTIRFDQGVSYWRISRSTEYRKRLFDFSERNPEQQARQLLKCTAFLEGGDFPTQLFVKMV